MEMDMRFELVLDDARLHENEKWDVPLWCSADGDQDSSYVEHKGICVDCGERAEILCDNYMYLSIEVLRVIYTDDTDHYWECTACKSIRDWKRMAAKAVRVADWRIMYQKYPEFFDLPT
jgi:hypothetical protein